MKVTEVTDPVPLLDTHRIVWTTHPAAQDPNTGELSGLVCYEVWVPTAAPDADALTASFAYALTKGNTLVQPSLISKTIFTPRHPKSPCKDAVIMLAVK